MSLEKNKGLFICISVFVSVTFIALAIARGNRGSRQEQLQRAALEIYEETGEAVTFFGALATVNPDGTVEVFIKTKFNVQQRLINWGIPIAIPISHPVTNPSTGAVEHKARKLKIKYVLLDGKDMPYESKSAGVVVERIYPIDKETKLAKGEHQIEVAYELEGAIETSNGFHELDFPVISSHLPVPVKQASAMITLPISHSLNNSTASGLLGKRKEKTGEVMFRPEPSKNAVKYWPARQLNPLEGMMVKLKWPVS